jgi:hypothetical protein
MASDRDRPSIGERLDGEYDPKDPDGLLTLDGVEPPAHPEPEVASEHYRPHPGLHKSTRRDDHNDPI